MRFSSGLRGVCICLLAATVNVFAASPLTNTISLPYPQGTDFPLEVYEVDAADAPALAAEGWNVFQSYKANQAASHDGYLAALASKKLNALGAIPCSGQKTNKIEWPKAKAQSWIRALASHPNMAWWDLPEEARPWSPRELKLLTDYTAWTRLSDPMQRPTYEYTPNNRNAAEISRIVPTVDIIGVSCYCEEMNMPHAWVRYKVEEAGLRAIALAGASPGPDYLHGQKIPVAIVYCAKFPRTGRMPEPDETYHDFWSAVVSGAQGIGVYAYHHAMRDDPALADNFERLNQAAREISGREKIGDVILWGEPRPGVAAEIFSGPDKTVSFRPPNEKSDFQYPSIHLLSKIKNGNWCVIAVNSTDQAVTTRITGLPATANARLPFENRSIACNGGNFTDTFKAWGVHIYKIAE